VSCQRILPIRHLEKCPNQKKDSDIQRHKHEHKNQVCLGASHEKQEYHDPPEDEIEPYCDVISWCSSSLRSISRCGIRRRNTPNGINKDSKAEEKRRESAAVELVRLDLRFVGDYVTRKAKKLPRIHSKMVARRSKMGPVKKKLPLDNQ